MIQAIRGGVILRCREGMDGEGERAMSFNGLNKMRVGCLQGTKSADAKLPPHCED